MAEDRPQHLNVGKQKGNQVVYTDRLYRQFETGRGLTEREVYDFCWNRPSPGRPITAGDVVIYRHHNGGDLWVAVVQHIVDDQRDPNIYPPPSDLPARQQHAEAVRRDPWPMVDLTMVEPLGRKLDPKEWPAWAGKTRTTRCREARVPGEPGWTWPEA